MAVRESGRRKSIRTAPSRASPKAGSRAWAEEKERKLLGWRGSGRGGKARAATHRWSRRWYFLSRMRLGQLAREVSMQLLSRPEHPFCGGLEGGRHS